MSDAPSFDEIALRNRGIRPTRQRVAVARLVGASHDTHVTPEQIQGAAQDAGLGLPLATIYNALNDFAKAGLVRRIDHAGRTCFCKNHGSHQHFLDQATGRLFDIPGPQPRIATMPEAPAGYEIQGIDVIIRLKPCNGPETGS